MLDSRTPAAGAFRRRLALLLTLTALAWSGSIARGGFSFDDREILESPVVRGRAAWTRAFHEDYWHHRGDAGHWRPLALLSLRLDRALFGEDARGFHATNVLMQLAVVALAALLLRALDAGEGNQGRARPPDLAWLGLGVFALHPLLADSVAWVSGRTSMLAAALGLAGALGVARARSWLAAAAWALAGVLGALCAKEDGAVFALLVLPLGAHRGRGRAALAGAAAGLAAAALLRAHALGSALPSAPHAPLAGAPLSDRLLIGGRALLEAARLAAVPLGYPPHYGGVAWTHAPPAEPLLGFLGLLVLATAVLLPLRALAHRPRSQPAWSLLLAAAAALPWLELVPAGEVFAPRFAYLPLLMAVPATDALLRAALPRGARGRALLVGAVALGIAGAWSRAGVYASRASFRQEVLRYEPADVASWNDLGLAREEAGDPDGARVAWEHCTELDPRYSRAWSNLGRLALAEGDAERALGLLQRAAAEGPRNPVAHVNLGSALARLGRDSEAARAFQTATDLAPGLAPAWTGLAAARARLDDPKGARAALERAVGAGLERARAEDLAERLGLGPVSPRGPPPTGRRPAAR